MRKRLAILLLPFLAGCFEDEPQLPQYYSKQYIDVAVDSVICYSFYEDFDHFILTCSLPYDSIHWFNLYDENEFLGSNDTLFIPNHPFGYAVSYTLFGNTDVPYGELYLNYCARYIYIPTSFTPNNDGINDKWSPNVYTFNYPDGIDYTIHWELRTLDGVKVFQSDNTWDQWDGTYNGHRMPVGSYLYYIELDIEGEDPVVYTGWLELFG